MPNHASIQIVGHLGADPVMEKRGDYMTCRLSVATTRKRKEGDLTTWWSVTCWRKDAEYAGKYLKKGDPVLIAGEPYLDQYTKDGEKRTSLKIEANRVTAMRSWQAQNPEVAQVAQTAQTVKSMTEVAADAGDDEPPF